MSAVQKELQRLSDLNRGLTPELVVDTARDPSNPLHSHFDWNDNSAAEKYRLWQARQLIASVKVTFTGGGKTVHKIRAYHSTERNAARTYQPVTKIVSDEDLMKQVLDEMQRDFERLQRKWASHKALFDAMIAKYNSGAEDDDTEDGIAV